MKQVLMLVAVLLLIIQLASADMGAYPSQFIVNGQFPGQLVVGNDAPATDTLAAIEVSGAIQQQSSSQIRASTEDEYDKTKSIIAIGQPCKNKAVADILGTTTCDIGLEEGQGYIKLTEKEGLVRLIVTGKTAADTRRAGRVLARYKNYRFMGNDIIVTGTLEAPQVASLQTPLAISHDLKPGCNSDRDCKASEYCSSGNCEDLGCPEGTEAKAHDCVKESSASSGQKTEPKPEEGARAPQESEERPSKAAPQEPQKSAEKRSFFSHVISFFRNLFS